MKQTALIFAGQGAQYVGMGKDLAESSKDAAELFDQADKLLGNNFKAICYEGPNETLTQTSYCQPALYVHGLALWTLLKKRNPELKPVAYAGLSLGEFTAHAAAEHFSFESGLKLVHERGRLMQEACEASDGGMLALIGASPEQAQELADATDLQVANYNSPGQIVLSGKKARIPEAAKKGKEMGIRRAMELNVAGAYHSTLMHSAQEGLKSFLDACELTDNDFPVYSNVNALPAKQATDIRTTLLKQVTGSVRWQSCLENMVQDGVEQFIELGPNKILAGMCKKTVPDVPCISIGTAEDLEALYDEIN
ncbi:MAG: ACP S-malonyltransferase [Verrucomicrobiota bacterium]